MVVTLVGAGGVATSLGVALLGGGHEVRQVWSRTETSARELAERLHTAFTTDLGCVARDVDCVIVSVKDSEVGRVAACLSTGALVLHTAGSVPLGVLPQARAGVIYPMQTFSKARLVDLRKTPLFIEAKRTEDLPMLRKLAESLSGSVTELPSDYRCRLHLAAVFACNFANHCYDLADELLRGAGLSFDIMLPLIDETARKVHEMSPREAQTGPAKRWDEAVMRRHLELLNGDELGIYRLMSESIHRRKEV
ncbi:MAG: DUF2520 domain-containing protein [Prevotellaceae bacterium]|nr:DUF2520 domain-containing protein [Prevotellaceae bacterium]